MRTTTDTPAHLVPPADIDRTANPLDQRNIAQANARESIRRARRARADARRTYGDRGEPNPCPVSGGLCDHWPEPVKNEIAGFETLAVRWDDTARAYHRAAGKRRSTYPAHFSRLD